MKNRTRRGYFIIFALSIIGPAAIVMGYGFLLLFFSGSPRKELDQADIDEIKKEGNTIVDVIYEEKMKTGLWPCSLDDLPRTRIPKDIRGWMLNWRPNYWELIHFGGFPSQIVKYQRRREFEGWIITDGEFDEFTEAIQRTIEENKGTKEQREESIRREIKRRIEKNPDVTLHYRGGISIFFREGQFELAYALCEAALEKWPDHWWVCGAFGEVAAKVGKKERAEIYLRERIKRDDSFPSYFILGKFQFSIGKMEDACKTFKLGTSKKIGDFHALVDAGENHGCLAGWLIRDAAWMAYDSGNPGIAIDLYNAYRQYTRDNYGKISAEFRLLCASSYCAIGDFTAANQMLTAKEPAAALRGFDYFPNDFNAVSGAVTGRNSKFRYSRNEDDLPISYFIEYE